MQHINALNHEVDTESMATNSELSLTQAILTVKKPISCFKIQIILEEGAKLPVNTSILFRTQVRHQISFNNLQDLLKSMKQCVNPNVVNGLLCELPTLALIKDDYPIYELLNFYKNTKVLVCDNERSLNSETIKAILKNHFGVTIYTTPPAHSTTNGQVERFHSTLTEIARCQRLETCISDTAELILLATAKYNRTIHSMTNRKPIDIIHAIPDELVNEIKNRLICTQQIDLKRHNIKRQTRQYKLGERVFVKTNKRIGNKFTKLYTEKIVQSDLGTYVLIDGRKVHKINLKH